MMVYLLNLGVTDFFSELMAEFGRVDAELKAIAEAEAAAAATLVSTMDLDGEAIAIEGTALSDTMVSASRMSDRSPSPTSKKKKKGKKKGRKGKKKKKKLEEIIPPSGPWLRQVHLADTFGGFSQSEYYIPPAPVQHKSRSRTLDLTRGFDDDSDENEKTPPKDLTIESQSLKVMALARNVSLYIRKCNELEELDFYNDWLGNGAATILLQALQAREKDELPRIGMRLNRGIDGAILKKIFKIASGVKKKKKRRKKSAKKK